MSASWLLYAIYNRLFVGYYAYVFIWWFIEGLSVDLGMDVMNIMYLCVSNN